VVHDQGEERVVEGDCVRYAGDGRQPGALAAEHGSNRGKEELATIIVAQCCCCFRQDEEEEEVCEGDLVLIHPMGWISEGG
jgi:hypothetical protein